LDVQIGHPQAAMAEAEHVLVLDHTVDPDTRAARLTIAEARLAIAQRAARARSRRRHRGHPPAARTST
jgi:hypothetical protein